jgi:hypothetical protein
MATEICNNHRCIGLQVFAALFLSGGLLCVGIPNAHAAKILPHPHTKLAGPAVERIVVQSGAWVLNPFAPFQGVIVITRDGDEYRLAGLSWDRQHAETYSGQMRAQYVERLVSALRAPLEPSFTFAGLGPEGSSALRKLQKSIRDDIAGKSRSDYSPSQKAVLARVESDPEQIEAVISRSRVVTHTDDFPSLSITVMFDRADAIEATSHSQHLYMLPWEIKERGKSWNVAIAEALHDLLPQRFQARERLTYDERSLSEMFDSGMSKQLDEAGAKDAAGDVMVALRSTFVVKTAAMYGSLGSTDFGPHAPHDLVAALAMPDSPPNLVMMFRVTMAPGSASNLDTEIVRAKALFNRVESVPFLVAQMRIHPEEAFTINYWYGTSLHSSDLVISGDETNAFAGYMRDVKGIALTKQQLDDAGMVHQDGKHASQWVVLPDGRTILWRKFAPGNSDANLKSCGIQRNDDDLMADTYHCVGLIFEPDGDLAK